MFFVSKKLKLKLKYLTVATLGCGKKLYCIMYCTVLFNVIKYTVHKYTYLYCILYIVYGIGIIHCIVLNGGVCQCIKINLNYKLYYGYSY